MRRTSVVWITALALGLTLLGAGRASDGPAGVPAPVSPAPVPDPSLPTASELGLGDWQDLPVLTF